MLTFGVGLSIEISVSRRICQVFSWLYLDTFFCSQGSLEIPRWKRNARLCIYPYTPWDALSVLWSHFLWLSIWHSDTYLAQKKEKDQLPQHSEFLKLSSFCGFSFSFAGCPVTPQVFWLKVYHPFSITVADCMHSMFQCYLYTFYIFGVYKDS